MKTKKDHTSEIEKREEFEILANPLIDWLSNNYDHHAKIIITVDNAELVRTEIKVY